jgi:serine/threonine protein kinase
MAKHQGERRLGNFRLVSQIAVGGMAEIYEAIAPGVAGFEKHLALKIIHPNYAEDPAFVQMLIDEAKLAVQLVHENIVKTYDLGHADGQYYISMELIDGFDLFRVLRRASEKSVEFPVEIAAYIAHEVAAGLDYAHKKKDPQGRPLQIVHRDVSPQNVLISGSGEVKLVDFGIAKASLRRQETAAGVIKGKYYYMSPEHAWGEKVDARSDVFAAGILLWEMLVGQMLYLDDDLEVLLDRVRRAQVERPSTKRTGLPRELEDIVMRALKRRPEERYQTAGEMATALATFARKAAPDFSRQKLGTFVEKTMGESTTNRQVELPQQISDDMFADENSLIFLMAPDEPSAGPRKLEPSRSSASPDGARKADQPTSQVSMPRIAEKLDYDEESDATIVDGGAGAQAMIAALNARRAAAEPDETPDADDEEQPTDQQKSAKARTVSMRAAKGGTNELDVGDLVPVPSFEDAEPSFTDENDNENTQERLRRTMEIRRKPKPKPPHSIQQPTIEMPPTASGNTPTPPSHTGATPTPTPPTPLTTPPWRPGEESVTPMHAAGVEAGQTRTGQAMSPARVRLIAIGAVSLAAIAAVIAVVLLLRGDTGSIEVTSRPAGAEVYIDGKVLPGVTPLEILDVDPAQTHTVRVTLAGYDPFTQDVRLEGRRTRIQAVLSAQTASLAIDSIPQGAEVVIAGKVRGTTPLQLGDLPSADDITVELRLRGYRPVTRRVSANTGRVSIPLEKMPR